MFASVYNLQILEQKHPSWQLVLKSEPGTNTDYAPAHVQKGSWETLCIRPQWLARAPQCQAEVTQ